MRKEHMVKFINDKLKDELKRSSTSISEAAL
jgi:hypothetical protein